MKKLSEYLVNTVDNRGRNPEKYYDKEEYQVIDNFLIDNSIYPNMNNVRRYIDKKTYDTFLRGYVHKNMPIITLVGAGIGNVTLVPNSQSVIIQNTIGFQVNKEILNEIFLYYYLKFHQEDIKKLDRGSAQPSIKKTDILKMEVDFPNLSIQDKIADILKNIDDKIELNNKINENLEQQAQAIYKNLIEHLNNKRTKPLSTLVNEIGSGDWGKEKEEELNIKQVYCVRGADIPNLQMGYKGKMPIRYITEKNYAKKLLSSGDIIIEISGGSPTQSTGRAVLMTEQLCNQLNNEIICTNFCRVIKPKKEYCYFVYLLLRDMYDNKEFFTYENGTTGIKNLNLKNVIDNKEITIPTIEELTIFNLMCTSIFQQIFFNSNINQKLIELRDALLPKLMSGEIDVENVQL